jgi:hypothetical protein
MKYSKICSFENFLKLLVEEINKSRKVNLLPAIQKNIFIKNKNHLYPCVTGLINYNYLKVIS